jgi:uncharacterized membrane protein
VRLDWLSVITLGAALGSGLVAGTFFAFSSFVIPSLARLPTREGIAAMQSINVVILNSLFMIMFLVTAALCVVIAVSALMQWGLAGSSGLLTGALLYLLGVLLVTVFFNVPLNETLAAIDPDSQSAGDVWQRYVETWTVWNHVRTVTALLASLALILAALSQ